MTIAYLVALAILLTLGTWQVQRLHWKEGLIAERNAALAAPPLDRAPTAADLATDLGASALRRVTITGRFRFDHELFVSSRFYRDRAGWNVVVPFTLATGETVLVNRGWVPMDARDPAKRAGGQVEGPVTISGLARPAERPNNFTPPNQPADNLWFWIDTPAMAAAAGMTERPTLFIEADATPNPGNLPIGGGSGEPLKNDHLQYAATWYSLAVVMTAIYLLMMRKGRISTRKA